MSDADDIMISDLDTITDNLLAESENRRDFVYFIKESWWRILGSQDATIYSLLNAYSSKYGYAFISDEKLAEKMGLSVRSIERAIQRLEKEKWIYRNAYNTKMGRKRHIITKENAVNYWHTVLKRPTIPHEVKQKYHDHFLKGACPNYIPPEEEEEMDRVESIPEAHPPQEKPTRQIDAKPTRQMPNRGSHPPNLTGASARLKWRMHTYH